MAKIKGVPAMPMAKQRSARVVDPVTFMIQSGNATLTLSFTRNGHLVTTHEYAGALVKRVSVSADRSEVEALRNWIDSNLNVAPYVPQEVSG